MRDPRAGQSHAAADLTRWTLGKGELPWRGKYAVVGSGSMATRRHRSRGKAWLPRPVSEVAPAAPRTGGTKRAGGQILTSQVIGGEARQPYW